MADLFISYSSHDRPWAGRLFTDLGAWYPTINRFWDQSPQSIPIGKTWRDVLDANAQEATHFVVLWSEHAKASNQVAPEIEMFRTNVKTTPDKDGATRTMFYVPLEGEYGPLEALQGYPEFRRLNTYDAGAADRGVSNLARDRDRLEWSRLITTIGDTIVKAETMQKVSLCIVAMNTAITGILDPFLNLKLFPTDPTLQEVLDALGITLQDVKRRYAETAFKWRPFGTAETVVDFMRDRRAQINAALDPRYWFQWDPWDLVLTASTNEPLFRQKLKRLAEEPSVVVIDPISLHNQIVTNAFLELLEYAQSDQSVIITLSPFPTLPAICRLYEALRSRGKPVLNGYFEPQVPTKGVYARCSINVQHPLEVERLVRSSLGRYFLKKDPLAAGA